MATLLENAGMTMVDTKGIAVSPGRGLHLSEDTRLNYLLAAIGRDPAPC
jgi:2-polyprenyl-6-hydroxyphenyl methylase/3-demethylubiquinone-9 3-methyltransferase